MANDESLRSEIESSFKKINTKLTPELERRCMTLCKRLEYTGRSLADAWEAHTLNHESVILSVKSFDFFQKQLLQQQQTPSQKTSKSILWEEPDGAVLIRKKARKDVSNSGSSSRVTPEKSTTAVNLIVSDEEMNIFSSRNDSGKVMNEYNPHSYSIPTTRSQVSCVVSTHQCNNVTNHYRNLFTPMDARANALEEQLLHLSEQIAEKYNLEESISPVQKPNPEEVCLFGRICNSANSGKMNSTTILLEGSRDYSQSTRIDEA